MFRLLKTTAIRTHTSSLRYQSVRYFSNPQRYDAIVLGAYTDGEITLTNTNNQHVSDATRHILLEQLKTSHFKKAGDVRLFYGVGNVDQVAVVSLGNKQEATQDCAVTMETARSAAAIGVQVLKKQKAKSIGVDISVDPHGAAEGAILAQFSFNKLKQEKEENESSVFSVGPFGGNDNNNERGLNWETGQIYGMSQNLARSLMTTPANLMTPKLFAEEVAYLLAGIDNIDISVHDKEWVIRQKMNSFLSVAQGSDEPLRFLEIHYTGGNETDPVYGLVGKGITFDSGGISLKPSANMALMKGDMGGAATVAATMYGISKLKLPVNVVAVTPLAENLPSGRATKPGDVVRAMNGKSIEVINTDAEGRLILADALHYLSAKYEPTSLIDIATLTGAQAIALGNVFSGVYTNSDSLWQQLNDAGQLTKDEFWRMPLRDEYLKPMKESLVADLVNSAGREGGAAAAAIFLREFLADPKMPWAHLDIAGVMNDSPLAKEFDIKGMTGRPTRSIIEYLRSCHTK
ncbi:cytosol aminopeptidase family, catalytic domain-containing protein [Phascolomyces articulosus]|uniref:Cytosol aminopeptidase family, catalytic domain-containing protein n=1 Tax=Phascolomyces articulosus TaxID=60185 RepID=A0AAD5JSF2_9FUNG|nr:cytosol aminopeptidase family, catalytic domain-containing protein [Phascolomyces articulosus]